MFQVSGEYVAIPDRFIGALVRYGKFHTETGGFLRACLENDFQLAVLKADCDAVRVLPQIARFIHNEMPRACHGSAEAVREWLLDLEADEREVSHAD